MLIPVTQIFILFMSKYLFMNVIFDCFNISLYTLAKDICQSCQALTIVIHHKYNKNSVEVCIKN